LSPVFVDTSAWYALIDKADADHRGVATAAAGRHGSLVTTNFVVDETLTLLRTRLGWRTARSFGDRVRAGYLTRLERVSPRDEEAAWDIFVRYSDHAFSFTDCTSFAVMRRLGLAAALAADADFRTFGFRCLP
jgi:uncharacterized protein